eukprot:CAMPEP_0204616372 /NCGR_PEP_ID=MMETSP0717-20131115/3632_1 /ASSEMBLY_ACC=CAM_ASM_000666 /TAXON_ID=230516 /ORGANISM="Chaetoceros curvisetus" /LENGTH=154 /DNA_ID=CAMNT_0051629591 /DNA_START=360 /DNA_END=824 /DNA_ORIENTATION=+
MDSDEVDDSAILGIIDTDGFDDGSILSIMDSDGADDGVALGIIMVLHVLGDDASLVINLIHSFLQSLESLTKNIFHSASDKIVGTSIPQYLPLFFILSMELSKSFLLLGFAAMLTSANHERFCNSPICSSDIQTFGKSAVTIPLSFVYSSTAKT